MISRNSLADNRISERSKIIRFINLVMAGVISINVLSYHAPQLEKFPEVIELEQSKDTRPQQIDDWLYNITKGRSPMMGLGSVYVTEADKHKIDWRLLPAISWAESSAGLHQCGYNAWGWASCKTRFNSYEEGISFILEKMETSPYYRGKSIEGILYSYNCSVNPEYCPKVIKYMEEIGE